MLKRTMLKFAPRWEEKHIRVYGTVLFFLGILYLAFALMLFVCYLPSLGVLIRGALMAWMGFALSEKDKDHEAAA